MGGSDPSHRQRQVRNLVVVALADGQMAEAEVDLIARRCGQLDLDAAEIEQAIQFGLDDNAALSLPSGRDERLALMRDLVQMISADGRMDEAEKRLFALAAVKMNLSSTDLDRLIESFLK